MNLVKIFFLSALPLFFETEIKAQANPTYFKLVGQVNIDSGTAVLMPVGGDFYYPGNHDSLQTPIKNGRFIFTDYCLYPYEFRLRINKNPESGYISDYFFVDRGTQNILCNFDSLREIPAISNYSMRELRQNILKMYSPINRKVEELNNEYDSLKKTPHTQSSLKVMDDLALQIKRLQAKKKELLSGYIINHPDSYVAMWELIHQFKNNGYETIFSSMYTNFSGQIKSTFTGQILAGKLTSASATALNARFPQITLVDTGNIQINVPLQSAACKYRLVDFWYSHCVPCIGQFPELKKIYEKYKTSGFMITGISIDTKEAIPDWKSAIIKYQLPWEQYLDINGKNAVQLSVLFFPTNFLLDSDGKIIRKNIEPSELNSFLASSLRYTKQRVKL